MRPRHTRLDGPLRTAAAGRRLRAAAVFALVLAGCASPGLRGQLEGMLAADDKRFEAATEEAARPLGVAYTTWWWQRVPLRRVGELAQDLRAQS